MAFQKYGDNSRIEVAYGEEARVLERHLAKTGKRVQDFTEDEYADLEKDLAEVRGEEPKETPKRNTTRKKTTTTTKENT